MLVSAKILRRAIVGTVTALGVGTMYLTPSLAGSPEQIAVPVPIETPSETPTPYPSDTETPSPDPYPTGETLAPTTGSTYKAPKPGPTSTYKYVPPKPYVPPKTTAPKPSKTSKPPKPTLDQVSGLKTSKIGTGGFVLEWTATPNAKKYAISNGACSGGWSKGTTATLEFPSTGTCDVKVRATASGYSDGSYSSVLTAKPAFAAVTSLKASPGNDASTIKITWINPAGAVKFSVTSDKCGDQTVTSSSATMTFDNGQTKCEVTVKAVATNDHSEGLSAGVPYPNPSPSPSNSTSPPG